MSVFYCTLECRIDGGWNKQGVGKIWKAYYIEWGLQLLARWNELDSSIQVGDQGTKKNSKMLTITR